MERDHRTPALHLGSTKDVFEDGHEEVHLGYGQNPPRVRRATPLQSQQYTFAAVLLPLGVMGVLWVFQGLSQEAIHLAQLLDTVHQMPEYCRRHWTHWTDDNTWLGIPVDFRPLLYSPLLFITPEAVFLDLVVKGLAVDLQAAGRLTDVPPCLFKKPLDV